MGAGRVLPKTGFYQRRLALSDRADYLWVVENRDTLGSVIRRLRANLGASRDDIGDQAGLSGDYVGQIERDEKVPSIEALWNLAKALGADAYRTAEIFELAGQGEFWRRVGEATLAVKEGVPSIDTFVDNTPELRSPEARVTARTVLKALARAEPIPPDEPERVPLQEEEA